MKVKELLTDESKWTQKVMRRDKFGEVLFSDQITELNQPASFCILGAINWCYSLPEAFNISHKVEKYVFAQNKHCCISSWNDDVGRRFEEIREMIETLDI